MSICAVILAGGQGRRMGGEKHRALLGEATLLDHVIARLAAQVDAVALAGDHPSLADHSLPVLPDDARLDGPAAGLLSALRWADKRCEPLLTAPCDMPFLPSTLAADLTGDRVAVPQLKTRPIWTIAFWPQAIVAQGLSFLETLDAGAAPPLRAVYDAIDTLLRDVDDPHAFAGINTPLALEEARQSCA